MASLSRGSIVPQSPSLRGAAAAPPVATPRSAARRAGGAPTQNNNTLEAYVRVRPAHSHHPSTVAIHDDQKNVTVRLASARAGPLGMGRSFSFDKAFGETTSQAEIVRARKHPLLFFHPPCRLTDPNPNTQWPFAWGIPLTMGGPLTSFGLYLTAARPAPGSQTLGPCSPRWGVRPRRFGP